MNDNQGIPVSRIAGLIGGAVAGDPEKRIYRVDSFENADDRSITFADKPSLIKKIGDCRAGAVVVAENYESEAPVTVIRCKNPRLAFAKIMEMFDPRGLSISGISSMASIGRAFQCGDNVIVGVNAFIGNGVCLGDRVIVHPGVYIGDGARIGDDTQIFPNVTIMDRCIIGKRVVIHSGSVIGSDGFGFTPDGIRHHKIPQIGIVEIEDDVEIGACNTIDRATFGRTLIGQGVKTDNQVHIAHNVTVGAHSIIVAQVGISGSTSIGSHVIIAGQAGIAGHVEIGNGATIGPQAGVARSVAPGRVVSGTPEMDHRLWLRVQREIPQLPDLKKRVSELEKKLRSLEKTIDSDTEG
jgi:UDP-3-O-[3-hydroxymyristoyl] glucosamine N-acyltransferase